MLVSPVTSRPAILTKVRAGLPSGGVPCRCHCKCQKHHVHLLKMNLDSQLFVRFHRPHHRNWSSPAVNFLVFTAILSSSMHSPQDLFQPLDCPASEPLTHHLYRYFSIFDLWFRPWRVAHLLVLSGVSPRPHFPEGTG